MIFSELLVFRQATRITYIVFWRLSTNKRGIELLRHHENTGGMYVTTTETVPNRFFPDGSI